MKNFLKEVLVSILVDITSRLIFSLWSSIGVLSGVGGILMNAYAFYFFITSIILILSLIAYEVYKTKTVGIGVLVEEKSSEEKDGVLKRHSVWLEIENKNRNADFTDCFVYLRKLDDNGNNLIPNVTKKTREFEWEKYSKSQKKIVKADGGKERVNIAFAEGGFDKKYFLLEGGERVLIPSQERIGIEIVVSGKMKGIRINFPVKGYLVHKMFDYEKTITDKFFIETAALQS